MHCSSCKIELDRYLEGTLSPRRMAQIREHLNACKPCLALLEEVKVVDALLFTTAPPTLPENFTFQIMAEVNALPAPQARTHRVWSFLAVYSAAAWVAAFIALVLTRTSPAMVAAAFANAAHGASAFVGHAFSVVPQSAPQLAAVGVLVLLADAFLAAGVAFLYFRVRPRLAASLVMSRRAGS